MRLLSLILLSLLLLPSLVQAGSARRFMVVSRGITGINGIGSINSSGVTDTGTETIATGAGQITVRAECLGGYDGSSVYLKVDDIVRDSITCGIEVYISETLTYDVIAGTYDIQVYGERGGTAASFSANTFVIPLP